MANNRMWLVNDRLETRVLLAKHNGDAWCFVVVADDMPCDCSDPMAWRIVYECDPSAGYTRVR